MVYAGQPSLNTPRRNAAPLSTDGTSFSLVLKPMKPRPVQRLRGFLSPVPAMFRLSRDLGERGGGVSQTSNTNHKISRLSGETY